MAVAAFFTPHIFIAAHHVTPKKKIETNCTAAANRVGEQRAVLQAAQSPRSPQLCTGPCLDHNLL